MIFKDEFQALIQRYAVSEYEKELMQFAWEKAEAVMQGKAIQDPVLLKDKPKVLDLNKLTKSELQFMSNLLSLVLNRSNEILEVFKENLAEQWNYCNKSDPETLDYYKGYLKMLGWYQKDKAKVDKLSEIQRKIKKQAGA